MPVPLTMIDTSGSGVPASLVILPVIVLCCADACAATRNTGNSIMSTRLIMSAPEGGWDFFLPAWWRLERAPAARSTRRGTNCTERLRESPDHFSPGEFTDRSGSRTSGPDCLLRQRSIPDRQRVAKNIFRIILGLYPLQTRIVLPVVQGIPRHSRLIRGR